MGTAIQFYNFERAITKFGVSARAVAPDPSSGVTVSLPAVSGKTNYLTKVLLITGKPTGDSEATVSISGIDNNLVTFPLVQNANKTESDLITLDFPEPIPATATNTAISVTVPSITNGATTTVFVCGYLL